MILKDLHIDKDWTLFLDRDGVINEKLENDYVKNWDEFKFIPESISALIKLNKIFGIKVVVTNQQGIGKGIYTHEDLQKVHLHMQKELEAHSISIDHIYYAPFLSSENHPWRKPGIGMALQAKIDFPKINFKKSIIVGDSISDMEFGRNAGMNTVYISNKNPGTNKKLIDFQFSSLSEFADNL